MARYKDNVWDLPNPAGTWDVVQTGVLMDIRDELKQLNRLLGCSNFTRIPGVLDRISRNTAKPRKKKRKSS